MNHEIRWNQGFHIPSFLVVERVTVQRVVYL